MTNYTFFYLTNKGKFDYSESTTSTHVYLQYTFKLIGTDDRILKLIPESWIDLPSIIDWLVSSNPSCCLISNTKKVQYYAWPLDSDWYNLCLTILAIKSSSTGVRPIRGVRFVIKARCISSEFLLREVMRRSARKHILRHRLFDV